MTIELNPEEHPVGTEVLAMCTFTKFGNNEEWDEPRPFIIKKWSKSGQFVWLDNPTYLSRWVDVKTAVVVDVISIPKQRTFFERLIRGVR